MHGLSKFLRCHRQLQTLFMQPPAMHSDTWQRAIAESWLLCAEEQISSARMTVAAADYLCFSTSHQGQPDHDITALLGTLGVQWLNAWCFYQEPDREPACEACLLISEPCQYQSMASWLALIHGLEQEHVLAGTDGRHWLYARDGNGYRRRESVEPRLMTLRECEEMVRKIERR